jgi:hypothetical protein
MSVPRSIALLPALALSVALLTGCGGGGADDAEPGPTPASDTPTAEPTDTPAPEETSDPEPPAPADISPTIVDAISSGNTAALYDLIAVPVHMSYCASEASGDISDRTLVVNNLAELTSPGTVWDFNLPASLIDNYANNPGSSGSYAAEFPAGAIVGHSSEDKVVSFVVTGALITRIFVCNNEYALTFED